jgi:dTDP-4-dehydrorhamnose reductase
MKKARPWLVVGGNGQLGIEVRKELIRRNIDFQALSSKELDIRDFKSVTNGVSEINPRVIVNCSGWTNVSKAEEHEKEANLLNAYAPAHLARTAQELNSVFVHVSSDYVFSGASNSPYKVEDTTNPVNAYGRSKALGEKLLAELSISRLYLFRTAWLYSEHRQNFVKNILKAYLSGTNPIKVVSDQIGSPTSASDLSFQIIESVIQGIPFGVHHAVNLGAATWYDLAQAALRTLNLDVNYVVPISYADFPSKVVRPRCTLLDMSKWDHISMPKMKEWDEALNLKIHAVFKSVVSENSSEI